MTTSEKDVQSIIDSLEQQERRARQRAFWYAAVPVLLVVLLVGFTALQIQKLVGVQAELQTAEKKLDTVNSEYLAVAEQSEESTGGAGGIAGPASSGANRLREDEKPAR